MAFAPIWACMKNQRIWCHNASDFIVHENHCSITSLMKKIIIQANPYIILYIIIGLGNSFMHWHQRGAVLPACSVSVFCVGRVFTLVRAISLCRSPILQHWAFDISILTNQRYLFLRVLQENRSMSDLCGHPQRAHCLGSADPRQCKQHQNISTNRSTAEPAGGIRAGAPCVFQHWCKCPLTGNNPKFQQITSQWLACSGGSVNNTRHG